MTASVAKTPRRALPNSEMPEAWERLMRDARGIVQRIRARLGEAAAPSRGAEFCFFQSLVGVWPYGWGWQRGP